MRFSTLLAVTLAVSASYANAEADLESRFLQDLEDGEDFEDAFLELDEEDDEEEEVVLRLTCKQRA